MHATFLGGTNVAPPPRANVPFKLNAPQVDFARHVLFPMLRTHFGLALELTIVRRGFLAGGGEVSVAVGAPPGPLPALQLLERGAPVAIRGFAFCSHDLMSKGGGSSAILERMVYGKGGASELLAAKLPDVPATWVLEEVADSKSGCGLLVVVETAGGALLAGDSMGRARCSAETVGGEAARAVLAELDSGGCTDEHLTDQLIIYMAMAAGTSRLRLGTHELSLHAQTGLWLAERFGASWRLQEDGRVLEVTGLGVNGRAHSGISCSVAG
jgi:RNA 3'-terminal phosphate cyclase (ATP)